MQKRNSDILNGNPFKAITTLVGPIMISGLFQQLYTTADGIIVGQNLGSTAHAVIGGSASNLIGIFNNLSAGLISGSLIVVAQATGAGDSRRKTATVKNGLLLVTLLSVIMMLVYWLGGYQLLEMLKVPQELLQPSYDYLRIYLLGFVPYSITMLLINLQRGMGESRRPTFMLVLNYLMYILSDFLFIIVFKMGMSGVPCAYIATYTISAVIMLVVTLRDYHVLRDGGLFDGATIKSIIRVGLPSAITSVFFAVSTALITTCMNRLGSNVVASYSVANKVANIMWIVMSALATATVTMVATNYGAKKTERIQPALNAALLLGFASTAVIWVICYVFRMPLLKMFSDDPEVLQLSAGILGFLTVNYFLYPVLEVYNSALKGTGHAMITTWITLICVGGARFGWLLGFSHLLTDVYRVLLAFPLAWGLTSIASFTVYNVMKKKNLSQ